MCICELFDSLVPLKLRQWPALILACLELIYSGYYYGFNSFTPAFKEKGLFNNSCTTSPCKEQDDSFGSAFTIALGIQLCFVPIMGILMDKVSLRGTKLLAVTLFSFGAVFYAVTNKETPAYYYIASILTSIGGTTILLCNFYISSHFKKWTGTIVAIYSGLFDSSICVAYFLSMTYKNLPITTSFFLLALFSLVFGWLFGLFMFTHRSSEMSTDSNKDEFAEYVNKESTTEQSTSVQSKIESIIIERYDSIFTCLKSIPFLLVVLQFSLGLLCFSLFLNQMNTVLNHLFPGEDTVKTILENSSIVLALGVIIAPITAFIMDYSRKYILNKVTVKSTRNDCTSHDELYWLYIKSIIPAFITMAVVCAAFSALIFVANSGTFYFALVCFVLFRSLLFSCCVTFCLIAFPIDKFGTISGVMNVVAGLFSFLRYALIEIPIHEMNILKLCIALSLFISPIVLLLKRKD